ncbi:MAG TPA: hypothetical protein VEA41_20765 [Salinarimonas sp.]|nr:hypothetical protein [Salinarimonas sp.]
MATYKQIVEGLQLLATCDPGGAETHNVDAEHDIIYAGPDISEVSDAVAARLEAIGWHRTDADRWGIYT